MKFNDKINILSEIRGGVLLAIMRAEKITPVGV